MFKVYAVFVKKDTEKLSLSPKFKNSGQSDLRQNDGIKDIKKEPELSKP